MAAAPDSGSDHLEFSTALREAREIVERAQAEAGSVLDQAWTEAERLMNRAEEDAGDSAGQELREREEALEAARAELEEAQRTFDLERTDLLQEARDHGYSLGLAEAELQTAAGMAILADVNTDLEALGEAPLVAEELIHVEIVEEPADDPADEPVISSLEAEPGEEGQPEEADDSEHVEDEGPIDDPVETPISSGGGDLRVVGSKSIDPSDVRDTMAKLRDAWASADSPKGRD